MVTTVPDDTKRSRLWDDGEVAVEHNIWTNKRLEVDGPERDWRNLQDKMEDGVPKSCYDKVDGRSRWEEERIPDQL